jgi:hypothetical protein
MSNQRSSRKRRKFYRQENARYPGRNFHHLLPRSRGGEQTTDNLLLIHVDRHRRWHNLFGTRSLEEVIQLLVRVHRAKGRCLYAKMGLPCRLAPCLNVRATHSSNSLSRSKAAMVQRKSEADGETGRHRVLQYASHKSSGIGEQRSGKRKQIARLKAVPTRETKKTLREGKV